MPPKPKFTKEEVVKAALEIVREKGIERLTARDLGTALGSSARPIFTLYNGMEELITDVRRSAMSVFEEYVKPQTESMPVFKQIGMGMVAFALEQPRLYDFLFMKGINKKENFDMLLGDLGITAERSIAAICVDYKLDYDDAKILFENVWIYTFGVGVLCSSGACSFSRDELSMMLSTEFCAMLEYVKNKKENDRQ